MNFITLSVVVVIIVIMIIVVVVVVMAVDALISKSSMIRCVVEVETRAEQTKARFPFQPLILRSQTLYFLYIKRHFDSVCSFDAARAIDVVFITVIVINFILLLLFFLFIYHYYNYYFSHAGMLNPSE